MRLFATLAMLVFLWAPGALAVTDLEKKDPAKEIVYRVNLGRAADVVLLIKNGVSPDQVDEKGTPLIALAAARKDEEGFNVLKRLLEAGADINARDAEGQNALFYAVRQANIPVIKFLLDQGISYYATDNKGNIARNIAFQQGNQNIVDMLDAFVTAQTEKVNAQYKEYNQKMEERNQLIAEQNKKIVDNAKAAQDELQRQTKEYMEKMQEQQQDYLRQLSESTTTPAPAENTAAKNEPDDSAEYVETLEEKKVKEAVAKRETPQFESDMRSFAFQACAFQYWSFCRQVKQRSDLSSEEMRLAIDTHREQVTTQHKTLTQEYQLKKSELDTVSKSIMQRINDALEATESNTYRFEHGVCLMPDLQNRCNEMAESWNLIAAEKKPDNKKPAPPVVNQGIGPVGSGIKE